MSRATRLAGVVLQEPIVTRWHGPHCPIRELRDVVCVGFPVSCIHALVTVAVQTSSSYQPAPPPPAAASKEVWSLGARALSGPFSTAWVLGHSGPRKAMGAHDPEGLCTHRCAVLPRCWFEESVAKIESG